MRGKAPLLACAALACLAVLAGGSTAAASGGASTTLSGAHLATITIDPADSSQMYASLGSSTAGWISADAGASWSYDYANLVTFDPANRHIRYTEVGAPSFYIQRQVNGVNSPAGNVTSTPGSSGTMVAFDATASGRVYVVTIFGGVWTSPNGVTGWAYDNAGLPELGLPDYVTQFAVSPADGEVAYITLLDGSLYRRGEDGTWAKVGTPPGFALGLTVSPDDPNDLWAVMNASLWRSQDAGQTWTNTGTPAFGESCQCEAVAFAPSNHAVVYVAEQGGVARSTDGGQSFGSPVDVFQGELIGNLAVMPGDASEVYATTAAGLFESTDGGGSWVPDNDGIQTDSFVHSLATDPQDLSIVYAGTDGGIWRSQDGGATWSYTESGLEPDTTRVMSVVISPFDPDSVYIQTSTGYYVSADDGATWSHLVNSDNWFSAPVAFDPSNSQRLIIPNTYGYQESLDGGQTFTYHVVCCNGPTTSEAFTAFAVDPVDSSIMFAGGNDGVWRSLDDGATWSNVAQPDCSARGACYYTQILKIDPNQPSTVYWAMWGRVLNVSEDGGTTWQQTPLQQTVYANLDPSTTPSTVIAGNGIEMLQSVDGGQTWVPGDLGPTGASAMALAGTTTVPQGNAPVRRLYIGDSGVTRATFVAQTPATGFATARVANATRRIALKRNVVGFSLTCHDSWGGACHGTFRLMHGNQVLASAPFSAAEGGTVHLTLRLSASVWKRLGNHKPLLGSGVVVTTGLDQTLVTARLNVSITRPRR